MRSALTAVAMTGDQKNRKIWFCNSSFKICFLQSTWCSIGPLAFTALQISQIKDTEGAHQCSRRTLVENKKWFRGTDEAFVFVVPGCKVYLLSSSPPTNTFGSGNKGNASSARGSWGTSVALSRCTSCCFGLSAWRSPAKHRQTQKDCKSVVSPYFIFLCVGTCDRSSSTTKQLLKNKNALVIIAQVRLFNADVFLFFFYLAAFTSEQPIVIPGHFVSADRAAFFALWRLVLVCL